MSLEKLLNQGKLKPHKTSKEEIKSLLELINRDIDDAKVTDISSDRRLATAYNAVLQTATILLYCKGYKTKGSGHHFITFQAMKEILGSEFEKLADYFDACRSKRNIVDYTYAWQSSDTEAEELIEEAEKFLEIAIKWLNNNYPSLV